MQFQRLSEDRFQLRLERDDELIDSLTRFAKREQIMFATFTGLGAASSARLAFFDPEEKQYETHDLEQHLEVVSLTGNISMRDGAPFVHVHAGLGQRDLFVIGGHVMALVARPTIEIALTTDQVEIVRLPDEDSGLALLDLSERL